MNELPTLIDIPEKLYPIMSGVNYYRYFLLEGGRGSAKSHSVARWILYLAENFKLRIVCGRETQNSIEESVYTILVDLIQDYELLFDIQKSRIKSIKSGSTITFKGFRDQGVVNIKGLEGVDILWIEEAQSITKMTLDVVIPTIRKENAKIFFTMNRFVRTDAVFERFSHDPDCLHIHIDYFENKHCPEVLKREAEKCKLKNEKDYKHIWLGEPLDNTEDYLFNFSKLAKLNKLEAFGDLFVNQSVMGVDFASGGGDLCVASKMDRKSNVHWELSDQIAWSDPDTDLSVGKTIDLYGQWKPDILIVDAGGLGYPMFISISKTIPNVIGFDGGKTDKISVSAGNNRAEGYLALKEFVDREWLICKSEYTIKELETIKKKYKANGSIFIQSKLDAKNKDLVDSPDRADSVMMAIFAIKHYLGKVTFTDQPIGMRVKRISKSKRR